jgi:HPt (histidine-containing phosphotransfer) domain-containing protein
MASGMDDYLSKPIVKEQLYEMLAKWVPDSKYIDPIIENTDNSEDRSPEDQKFWDRMSGIDGLSCNIGLERVSGQAEIYKDTLKLFTKETPKYISVLTELLAANDMHNFTIKAHSIKSSLANVGAMSISAKAYELESAGLRKDTEFCASHLQSFSKALEDLSVKITEAFSELPKGNGSPVISTELELILKGMMDSLNGKKYIEINDNLKKLETQKLDGSLKERIEEIMDAIIIMDYQSALDEIQKLLNPLDITYRA